MPSFSAAEDFERTTKIEDVWLTKHGDKKPDLSPFAKDVLTKYSGIAPDQLDEHIMNIRKELWKVAPYPCIGLYYFVQFAIHDNPHFDEAVDRVKKGQSLLDIGCMVGQNLRAVASQGAPSDKLFGFDLTEGYFTTSYTLFNDHDKFKGTLTQCDALADKAKFETLYGQIDMEFTSIFLHLFPLAKQEGIAEQMLRTLKPVEGSLIFGRETGSPTKSGWYDFQGGYFRHTTESMSEMWQKVAGQVGIKVQVDTKLNKVENVPPVIQQMINEQGGEDLHSLEYSVRVVA